ncbi:MAG: hypothetical protein ACI4I9_04990 [Porcipelethomonas sp.]
MLKKIFSVVLCAVMLISVTSCKSKAEKKGDYLTGNKWETASGMLLSLKDDNTFKFYNNSADRKNNYYSGTYSVSVGQDAIDFLSENLGLDPASQKSTLSRFSVTLEDYYALVLNNEERIIDDENTLEEPNSFTYYGYYSKDYETLTLYNYDSQTEYNFKKK